MQPKSQSVSEDNKFNKNNNKVGIYKSPQYLRANLIRLHKINWFIQTLLSSNMDQLQASNTGERQSPELLYVLKWYVVSDMRHEILLFIILIQAHKRSLTCQLGNQMSHKMDSFCVWLWWQSDTKPSKKAQ